MRTLPRVSLLLSEADEHLEVLVRTTVSGYRDAGNEYAVIRLIGIRRGFKDSVEVSVTERRKGTTVAVSIPYPGGGNLA
jgi:hypothetical protein